uniref:Uncharacterized protein n=1 Tax=Arundo donax TaxID=35708 RepID=A0A0A9CQL3_ARUDO
MTFLSTELYPQLLLHLAKLMQYPIIESIHEEQLSHQLVQYFGTMGPKQIGPIHSHEDDKG